MKKDSYEKRARVFRFIGGAHDWVGEIDITPSQSHPRGIGNWWRLKNPCIYREFTNSQGTVTSSMMSIYGPGQNYQQYVDIHVPEDSIIEIMEVYPGGTIDKLYQAELKRKESNLYIPDQSGNFVKPNKLR